MAWVSADAVKSPTRFSAVSVHTYFRIKERRPDRGTRILATFRRKTEAYLLSQWKTLQVYLDGGRVAIDNNEVESAIRAIALRRKNHIFVGSEQGGHDAAVFYSLIESCKAAGVEPMAYLQDVIGRAATLSPAELGVITPARWKADRDAAAATASADSPATAG
jgi:hypothetical protein